MRLERISQAGTSIMVISYNRPAYVSGIDTPTAQNVTTTNEVQLMETKGHIYATSVCFVHFYGTGSTIFELLMLQAGTKCSNGIKYDKTFFKALYFLVIKVNA